MQDSAATKISFTYNTDGRLHRLEFRQEENLLFIGDITYGAGSCNPGIWDIYDSFDFSFIN
jgi:hypothetical protein